MLIFQYLHKYGYITQKTAVKESKLDLPIVSKFLNKIENERLVHTTLHKNNSNKPIKHYRLTPKGAEVAKIIKEHLELIDTINT